MDKAAIRVLGLEPIVSDEVVLLAPLPQFWAGFEASQEFEDGLDDPLDRYSKRVIGALARELNVEAVFPSDGPPYAPFISWALRAEGVFEAPIGLLVHDEFGLWISFRGALRVKGEQKRAAGNPCVGCAAPCLSACPVGAFADGGYDVAACKAHLRSEDVECWRGCLARRVCPAGKIARSEAQNRFHMRAFAG